MSDDAKKIVSILASASPEYTLKEATFAALSQRASAILNDYKKMIAENYFGSDSLDEQVAPELRRKKYQRIKQGLNTHNLTTYKKPAKKTKPMNDAQRAIAADMRARKLRSPYLGDDINVIEDADLQALEEAVKKAKSPKEQQKVIDDFMKAGKYKERSSVRFSPLRYKKDRNHERMMSQARYNASPESEAYWSS